MEWTSIVLAVITLLGGCGWIVDRHKHKQEVEGLKEDNRKKAQEVESIKADNRQKDMDLSKMYVDEFKENIAEPLRQEMEQLRTEVSELRKENASLRRETGGLRREIKQLKDAIQKIYDCPHAADCPVYDELQKQQNDVGTEDNGTAS